MDQFRFRKKNCHSTRPADHFWLHLKKSQFYRNDPVQEQVRKCLEGFNLEARRVGLTPSTVHRTAWNAALRRPPEKSNIKNVKKDSRILTDWVCRTVSEGHWFYFDICHKKVQVHIFDIKGDSRKGVQPDWNCDPYRKRTVLNHCALLTNPRQSTRIFIKWLKLPGFFSAKKSHQVAYGFPTLQDPGIFFSKKAYSVSLALLRSVHIVSSIKVQSSLTRVWIWVNLQNTENASVSMWVFLENVKTAQKRYGLLKTCLAMLSFVG